MISRRPQAALFSHVTLEQLRAGLDYSPVPTAILQRDEILYINPAGLTLLGEEQAEQIVHESILGPIDGRNDPIASEECRRIRIHSLMNRKEQIFIPRKNWIRRHGKWARHGDGTLIVEVQAWPIPLTGGDGVQIAFADITEDKQVEQMHREDEEQLRLAIDSAEIGIWDFDPIAGKTRCSKRCKQIFGLPWDAEIDYSSFLAFLHSEDRNRMDRAVRQSLNPGGTGNFGSDYRVVFPNGETRWIAAKGRVFFTQMKDGRAATRMIGAALDITDLRQSDAPLRQTEKLAVSERLAASLAHEINNPLEAVTNLLFLLGESTLQPDQREYVTAAQQELNRVIDVATQTLRFYRDPGPPKQCNLPEIVDSVLVLFGGRITGSRIRIERRYCVEGSVLGAGEEIRQIFVNLIQNAMNAMPHGGRLLLRIRKATQWPRGQRGVRISVADTGHGMDRETMARIFEPFFTTREAIGTGLGLWLSNGIVQQHGGIIRVKSSQRRERSGTVFSIFLPLDRRQ